MWKLFFCMEQILSRYRYTTASNKHKKREQQLLLSASHENEVVLRNDDSMKGELELAIERLKGKEFDGMSFSVLISLENQLNKSLHSVKDQKVQIMLNQIERSRLQYHGTSTLMLRFYQFGLFIKNRVGSLQFSELLY